MIYIIAWFVMGFGTVIMCIVDDYLNRDNYYSMAQFVGMFFVGCFGPITTIFVIITIIEEEGYFFTKKRFVK